MDKNGAQKQDPKGGLSQVSQSPMLTRRPLIVGSRNTPDPAANKPSANGVDTSETLQTANFNAIPRGPNGSGFKIPFNQTPIPNLDLGGYNRPPGQGGLMYFANGSMLGPGTFTPGVYSGFVPTPPVVPNQGHQWAMEFQAETAGLGRSRPWTSLNDKIPFNQLNDGAQNGFYPAAPAMERTGGFNYQYNIPATAAMPFFMPYQMMKTSSGYMVQDLEALTQQHPPIPRAVPSMWTSSSELTLAKCLENREGITNVYIRGFLPETTDEILYSYATRFGQIDRCKAIIDLETGRCKGFGFVQYFNFESCENCIRGFYYLGYQASYAQKSRNSRLKDLEDKNSTNIYCTNVPVDWTEADLRRHFEPYKVLSEKISRDEKTGVCKEVGFARFETREIAEKVLSEFHNVVGKDGVKLLLRFADTKAQKLLKQQSIERRAYRSGEYNFSVGVSTKFSTPPSMHRLQQTISHISPNSPLSYQSAGIPPVWTPATTISPPAVPVLNNSAHRFGVNSWPSRNPFSKMNGRRLVSGPGSLFNPQGTSDTVKTTLSEDIDRKNPQTPVVSKKAKAESVSQVLSPKEDTLKRKSSV